MICYTTRTDRICLDMNLSLPPPPTSPSDTIAGLPDPSTLSETTAPSDISDTIAGLPDPSTLSGTAAPSDTIAGLPDPSTLSETTASILHPSVEDVPKKFMDVPGGMSKGKDGIWYRNLPVNRPDGVQKMAVTQPVSRHRTVSRSRKPSPLYRKRSVGLALKKRFSGLLKCFRQKQVITRLRLI